MDANLKRELSVVATKVRKGIIEGTFNAKSGHPGGSLSIAEVITYLYFKEMNIDPQKPVMEERDRFVLSKGHAAPENTKDHTEFIPEVLNIHLPRFSLF